MNAPPDLRPRVGIVTLGCDKNTVDNEYLAGMIERAGGAVVVADDGLPLDAAVVTTCGFIAEAKRQSIDAILELAARKRETGSPRRLYVAGCLSQRYGEDMMKEIPEIDGLVGVGQFKRITEMIAAGLEEKRAAFRVEAGGPTPVSAHAGEGDGERTEAAGAAPATARAIDVAPTPTVDIYAHLARKPLRNAPHAFLKVSDGCNHACTFCAIPSMKGRLRSVRPEILVAEAKEALARGARELCLVSQDLSDYGRDLFPGSDRDNYRLPELLRELAAIPGDFWIRCLYYYPGNVNERFLEVLASEPKIVPYLEMPLQHLHPDVLRRMRRPFHEKNTIETVERIRAAVPGVAIRSTMILGFPGETDEEFEFLMDGLKRVKFDRLGAFEYSTEDGTPAGAMAEQVPDRARAKRRRRVMERQAKIADRLNRERVGERTRVLIEGYDERSKLWVGRSPKEAPEVDGKTLVVSEAPLKVGEFVDVKIVGSTTYDVYAEPVAG